MSYSKDLLDLHTVIVGTPAARTRLIQRVIAGSETPVHLIKSSTNPLATAQPKPGWHGLRISLLDQAGPIEMHPGELTVVADIYRLLKSNRLDEIVVPLQHERREAVFGTHDVAFIDKLARYFSPKY